MSTTPVSSTGASSTAASTGYALSTLGSGSAEQITGLASGLDTDQIISEEMAIYEQPVTNLQNQTTDLTAQNTSLSAIQTQLQTLWPTPRRWATPPCSTPPRPSRPQTPPGFRQPAAPAPASAVIRCR